MTGIELLWGIATNLASSYLENSLPETTYMQHLRRVLHKATTEFSARYPLNNPDNKILFYNSQTFYTECLKFRYYAKINVKAVHQALKLDVRIADCPEDSINAFLNLLFYNANKDEELKKYFLEDNYREEVFTISQKLEALMESLKQAQTNTININGDNNIVVQDAKDIIFNILNSQVREVEHKQEERLQAYKAKMAEDYEKTIFEEEKVRLKDIYIEPCYGVHRECLSNERYYSSNVFQNSDASLHTFIEAWINKSELPHNINRRYVDKRVLLLLGQPGQGKSSFCSRLMYDAFHQQNFTSAPIFRINFRQAIDINRLFNNPLTALHEFLKEKTDLDLHKDVFRNCVILLDGLDELVMQEKVAASQEDAFLKTLLNDVDSNYPNIRIIITSRYQVNTEKIARDSLVINLSVLSNQQQHEWLRKYLRLCPDIALNKSTLEQFQKRGHIAELISQPILLYLLTQVHKLENPIDSNANRATLYKQLFDLLVERRWANKGKQIPALEGIDTKTLRLFLREIAFSIFKSDYEYIHKTQVPVLIKKNQKLGDNLDVLNKDALKGLMLAFYMQEANKTDADENRTDDKSNYAIEFMHKSLQEYLVAEHIWENIKEISETKRDGDFYITDWNEALKILAHCFNDKFITPNITALLIEIIENDDEDIRTIIFKRLYKFLPQFVELDFLYEYNRLQNKKPINDCLNTFYGFLNIISHSIKDKNYLTGYTKKAFVDLLVALIRYQPNCTIILSAVDLSETYLYRTHLKDANLRGANLRGANLNAADLSGANLRDTDLKGADLSSADLSGADLSGADLSEANLSEANLSDVNLYEARLSRANLSDADLSRASLSAANLSNANLSSANMNAVNLSNANLSSTNMNAVNLSNAILSSANMNGATLNEATLNGATLNGASLYRADLIGANLNGVNLIGANLSGANLSDADLYGADLYDADLQGAKLKGAKLKGAKLYGAKVNKADLYSADFYGFP